MSSLPRKLLGDLLDATQSEAFEGLLSSARDRGISWTEVHLASLPRRLGKAAARGGLLRDQGVAIVAESFRACDLGAACVLSATPMDSPQELFRLYEQGDHEERRMILKALPFVDQGDVAIRLLQEAHRTNEDPIFIAGFADSDLSARILDDADYARGVLKAAFTNLDSDRLIGIEGRTQPGLSQMLLEFMSEREAAHRAVWPGSLIIAAQAPCDGVLAKVHGDLWSGVDDRRRAAAIAALHLSDASLVNDLKARQKVERVHEISTLLEVAIAAAH